ncbi:MAG TPA: hypothetical protein DC064_00225, partial [Cyanobacteria bacterium UBA9273]|nr:hypothetical protein [Cyanobacteria bacterium UBA9273]
IFLEIFAVVLNLLPIPPLDGYGIIRPWLPDSVQHQFNQLGKYSIWFIFGLLWFVPAAGFWLGRFVYEIAAILQIPLEAVQVGWELFDKPTTKLVLILALMSLFWLIKKHEKTSNNRPDITGYHQGNQLQKAQHYEDAIAAYDQALKLNPNYCEAWYERGLTLEKLNQFEEAIASYQQTVQIKPDFYQAWYQQGVVFNQLQQYQEALAAYDRVLEIRPDDCNTWFVRGLMLEAWQNPEAAIASYDKAIEIEPNFYGFWFFRGNALNSCQSYQDAIDSYERAIQLKPDYVEAWHNRSHSLYQLQRYEEAITSYDRVLEIQPESANSWYNRACCRALQGNLALALQTLQQAISLEPDFRDYAKTDSDFDAIREEPLFQKLIG